MDKKELNKILVDEIRKFNLHNLKKAINKGDVFMDSTVASLTLIKNKLDSIILVFSDSKKLIILLTNNLIDDMISYLNNHLEPVLCGYCADARLRDEDITKLRTVVEIISKNVDILINSF